MRLGIIAYIIPFVFPFSLGLLLQGSATDIVLSVATAVVGMFFMGWGLVGYFVQPIGWLSRAVFIAAGLMVLPSPTGGTLALYSNVIGFALAVAVAIAETLRYRRGRQVAAGTAGSSDRSW
jgi:TRAP-type uncharacterized transport system fused permease subunit